jgi:uncharacterized protein involved in exopolysaccharide biosynthesis
MTDSSQESEKEIELVDLLRVIWKWKYMILSGMILFALVAVAVNHILPEKYKIDMILKPGIQRISSDGQNYYIDSPQNIKSIIEARAFDQKIIERLNKDELKQIPAQINLKIKILKGSDTIIISYETSNVETGKTILNNLYDLLIDKYKNIVKYYQEEHKTEVKQKNNEIKKYRLLIQSSNRRIDNLTKIMAGLRADVDLINKNTELLIEKRMNYLSEQYGKNDILSALLFTNTIQQNLTLANTYKSEMHEYAIEKENELQEISKNEESIQNLSEIILYKEFMINQIENIQVLHPPKRSAYPIKPNKKMNLAIATVAGGILMLFLSFLIEYVLMIRKRDSIK